MGLTIRDPLAGKLAKEIALRQGKTMTAVVIGLLEREANLQREELSLGERIDLVVQEAKAMAEPGGHRMTKNEIDAMWGQ